MRKRIGDRSRNLGRQLGKIDKINEETRQDRGIPPLAAAYKVISGRPEGVASVLKSRYVTCDPRGVTHTHIHARTYESIVELTQYTCTSTARRRGAPRG